MRLMIAKAMNLTEMLTYIQEDANHETRGDLLHKLACANLYLVVLGISQLDGKGGNKDRRVDIDVLRDGDSNEVFLPVYSDVTEIPEEILNQSKLLSMPMYYIIDQIYDSHKQAGIIVNPFSHGLVLRDPGIDILIRIYQNTLN